MDLKAEEPGRPPRPFYHLPARPQRCRVATAGRQCYPSADGLQAGHLQALDTTSMRKVVITGIGVVTPLGCDVKRFWERNVAGVSGVRRVQMFDASPYPSQIAGEVIEFNANDFLSKKYQRRADLYCHYAIAATKMAVVDAGLEPARADS
ncbi:MAG: hypothetical protein L6437_04060, partial [Kiritimatiellae bacterium]|nr:hypothetical protein [Kiritimatiellia bacterium]